MLEVVLGSIVQLVQSDELCHAIVVHGKVHWSILLRSLDKLASLLHLRLKSCVLLAPIIERL